MRLVNETSEAPILKNAVIALGVNGVTNQSTEAQLVAAIQKLQTDASSFTMLEANLIYEKLANKILLSEIFTRMQFIDPISKTLFKEGITISSAKEIIDYNLVKGTSYERDKRFSDAPSIPSTLSHLLSTIAQKKMNASIFKLPEMRSAFASEQAAGQFISRITGVLAESLQYELYDLLKTIVVDGVKNTITLPPQTYGSMDKIFQAIKEISADMAKIPTNRYNLGFADAATAMASTESRRQVTPRKHQMIWAHPSIKNALDGNVGSVKFHNAYFKTDEFHSVNEIEMSTSEILLVDKNFAQGYFRVNQIATQNYANNLEIEQVLHYWIVFGHIPWANGVKIKFTLPADVQSALPAYAPAPHHDAPEKVDKSEVTLEDNTDGSPTPDAPETPSKSSTNVFEQ